MYRSCIALLRPASPLASTEERVSLASGSGTVVSKRTDSADSVSACCAVVSQRSSTEEKTAAAAVHAGEPVLEQSIEERKPAPNTCAVASELSD